MADVHHVISLGIGSPADIPHFTLFGLSPTGPVAVLDASADIIVLCCPDDLVVRVPPDDESTEVP